MPVNLTIDSAIKNLCSGNVTDYELNISIKRLQAHTSGLSSSQLVILIQCVGDVHNKLSNDMRALIIQDLLVPKAPIPDVAVHKVVNVSSSVDKSYVARKMLLRWLAVVYGYLENPNVLQNLFGVVFLCLIDDFTRPGACHLLAVSATPGLIRPWRVQYLLELHKAHPECLELRQLIASFRALRPELFPDETSLLAAQSFTNPDCRLALSIGRLWTNLQQKQSHKDKEHKRLKSNHTTTNPVVCLSRCLSLTTVLESLNSSQLQLMYSTSDADWYRFNTELSHTLAQLQSRDPSHTLDRYYLLGLADRFVKHFQKFPPAVEEFLYANLSTYSGKDDCQVMFSLVSRIPVMHFTTLEKRILRPFAAAFSRMNKQWRISCFSCLTSMVTRWSGNWTGEFAESVFSIVDFVNVFGQLCLEQNPRDYFYQDSILKFYEALSCHYTSIFVERPMPPAMTHMLALSMTCSTFSRLCGIINSGLQFLTNGDEKTWVHSAAEDILGMWFGRPKSTDPVSLGLSPAYVRELYKLDPSVDQSLDFVECPLFSSICKTENVTESKQLLELLKRKGFSGFTSLIETIETRGVRSLVDTCW